MYSIFFLVDENIINIRSNSILAHFYFAPDVAEFMLIAPWLLDLSVVCMTNNLQNVEETPQSTKILITTLW